MKQKKKKKVSKVIILSLAAILLFSTGVFAATRLLSWTGHQTLDETGRFLDQVTIKLIKSESEKNQAIIDREELEKEIEDLKEQIKDLEDNGWTEKDQIIVDLNDQLIGKQNEIDHLTRELQRANDAADVLQIKLNDAKKKLEDVGINIYN